MKPKAEETTASFVCHIENEQLAMGAHRDTCMEAHCARLQRDADFAEQAEVLRYLNDIQSPGAAAT